MKQERKFSLAEVHTKMGTMGEVRLNQTFLDVLGVKPGDFLVFTVSKEGGVTVAGEKQTTHTDGVTAPDTTNPRVPHPDQVDLPVVMEHFFTLRFPQRTQFLSV